MSLTTPQDTEQQAFELFATAYPHEAFDNWPDRFWRYFTRRRPGVTHEEMVRHLDETRGGGGDAS